MVSTFIGKKSQALAIFLSVCLVSLLSLMLTGCSSGASDDTSASSGSATEQATTDSLLPNNTLIVGLDNAYPPYGYVGDDGELTGFDVDLAREVAARNGWDIQLEAIDWDAKDALLNQGSINCIWNGFTIEGREDDYTFSEPYMINAQVIVVRSDSGITDEEGLSGRSVMTQVDSAALEVLEGDRSDLAATFAGGAPQTIGDYNTAFMQLDSGAVDAVACDLSIAAYQIAANPDTYTQIVTLSEETYGVGFAKGDTELAQVVSDTLRTLNDEGFIEQLCEEYADQGISYENWLIK